MNFKEYYTEQTALSSTGGATWYDNLKDKAKNAGQKIRNFSGDVEKGLQTSGTYKLGKDLGKVGLKAAKLGLQTIDPFSNQGLLGKVTNAVKKADNWAKTGSGFVDNIYGKEQGSADDAVKKGNEHEFFTNIRNTFKNNNKTKAAYADAVANSVIPPGQQLSLYHPKDTKTRKDYTNIEHYANVVLDQFKHYLVNKNYNENDSGKYTVEAFTTRTSDDDNKNKIMLKILKKHGLLYDAIAKYVY